MRHRNEPMAAGRRPARLRAPDDHAPGLAEECALQSWMIRIAEEQDALDDDAWHDVTDTSGWTA